MARPPKGKALTLRPIRLDDDVWAECQRLGKAHGTINEGLRSRLMTQMWFDVESNSLITAPSQPKPRSFKGPLLKPKDRK